MAVRRMTVVRVAWQELFCRGEIKNDLHLAMEEYKHATKPNEPLTISGTKKIQNGDYK